MHYFVFVSVASGFQVWFSFSVASLRAKWPSSRYVLIPNAIAATGVFLNKSVVIVLLFSYLYIFFSQNFRMIPLDQGLFLNSFLAFFFLPFQNNFFVCSFQDSNAFSCVCHTMLAPFPVDLSANVGVVYLLETDSKTTYLVSISYTVLIPADFIYTCIK